MGKENSLPIIFDPIEPKVELDENSMKTLTDKLNTFLEEENLDNFLREGSPSEIRAKYICGRFQGGPSFILNRTPNDKAEEITENERYWDLFIAQGPSKYVEMKLNRKGGIQDIQHDFNEKAYRTEIILGWFEGVFNSIKAAKKRHAFTWEIKY